MTTLNKALRSRARAVRTYELVQEEALTEDKEGISLMVLVEDESPTPVTLSIAPLDTGEEDDLEGEQWSFTRGEALQIANSLTDGALERLLAAIDEAVDVDDARHPRLLREREAFR